jgi:hypothetical protein
MILSASFKERSFARPRNTSIAGLEPFGSTSLNWRRDEEARGEAAMALSAKLSFKRLCSDDFAHSGPSIISMDGADLFPEKATRKIWDPE